jgi:uncharacterized protein
MAVSWGNSGFSSEHSVKSARQKFRAYLISPYTPEAPADSFFYLLNRVIFAPAMDETIILCVVTFFAGFIDSIVGGGGLIQTPAMLVLLPGYPVATVLGTTKIPSMTGTTFAAYRYSREVDIEWKVLLCIAGSAFIGSIGGSYAITLVKGEFIKPVILMILMAVAVYTYWNKNFGLHQEKSIPISKQIFIGLLFGSVIGFYDGMIGPGTGSFLILCFVLFLGKDFLHASANAKLVNISTNLASILFFSSTGHILYQYAIPMAVFNLAGSYLGTRLALLRGNKFIRLFFMTVILGTILRFAYDIWSAGFS